MKKKSRPKCEFEWVIFNYENFEIFIKMCDITKEKCDRHPNNCPIRLKGLKNKILSEFIYLKGIEKK